MELIAKQIQKCNHPYYYTINNSVSCNKCHKYLGYFDPWKLCGFVKETEDVIADKYINEKIVKFKRGNKYVYRKIKQ